MKYIIDNQSNLAFIRLDIGEEIFSSLLEIAKINNWQSAHISGIGALTDVTLGYYELKSKTYLKQEFTDEYELLSLEGNLTKLDNEMFWHIHTTLGRRDFSCFGGHLFSAIVAVTCEINARIFNNNVTRTMNDKIGICHIDF